jgi:type II secretory pathway pseudopilin PulG
MAALLVMVAVLTILMSAAMPVWRRETQREKEEELVFRGLQYVRAIRLYQAKTQSFPPSIDVLVQGRYLRKKYKDPITNDDFVPLSAAGGAAGQIGQPAPGGPSSPSGRSGQPGRSGVGSPPQAQTPSTPTPANPFAGSGQGTVIGGIIGVASKSKAESIRIYQGRNHYNEWPFLFVNNRPGGPGGRGMPGGPGGQPVPGAPGRGGRGERGSPFPGGRGMRGVPPPGTGPMSPFPPPGRGRGGL